MIVVCPSVRSLLGSFFCFSSRVPSQFPQRLHLIFHVKEAPEVNTKEMRNECFPGLELIDSSQPVAADSALVIPLVVVPYFPV